MPIAAQNWYDRVGIRSHALCNLLLSIKLACLLISLTGILFECHFLSLCLSLNSFGAETQRPGAPRSSPKVPPSSSASRSTLPGVLSFCRVMKEQLTGWVSGSRGLMLCLSTEPTFLAPFHSHLPEAPGTYGLSFWGCLQWWTHGSQISLQLI